MKDYVKIAAQWLTENESVAANNIGELVIEISNEIKALELQRTALLGIAGHLRHLIDPEAAEAMRPVDPETRASLIKIRAKMLVKKGHEIVTPEEIHEDISKSYVDLDVQNPTSVIATVLANSPDFKRIGKGKFQYIGEPIRQKEKKAE